MSGNEIAANKNAVVNLAKMFEDVLNTKVEISWFKGMEDQIMLNGNEADGAVLKFTHAGKNYSLKIFYTFTEVEYDRSLHQAILTCDGKKLFDIGATYDGIGNSVLNRAQ